MTSPLSQAQLSIYLSCKGLAPEGGNHQQAHLFKLPPSIDLERLAAALEAFVAAHPYILSRIVDKDGSPVVETPGELVWKATVTEAGSLGRDGLAKPMALDGDRLFRLEIYRTPDGNYLYADFHHIIFDGTAAAVFIRDLDRAYRGETLQRETFSGADIAAEEAALRASDAFGKAREWFVGEFGRACDLQSGVIPDVHGDRPLPHRELFLPLDLGPADMKEVTAKHRHAESVLFNTAFGLTLAAWNADTKAMFATVWNGRGDPRYKDSVTMCVHTQPVYVEADPGTPLSEVLDHAKAQTAGMRENCIYSLADAAGDMDLNIPVLFCYQGRHVEPRIRLVLGDAVVEGEDLRTNPPGYDLSAQMFSLEGGTYAIRFWYRPDKYSEEILRDLAESFCAVVRSMASARTAGELRYCSDGQIKVLDGFQPLPDGADTSVTPVELFRRAAAAHPYADAVVCGDTVLNYEQLDRLSDNMAAYIQQTVPPGSVVSIMLGRNEFMALAPLGVLKAGCAFEPLDPSYPKERLQFMVEDARSALLVVDDDLLDLIPGFAGPVLKTSQIRGLPTGAPSTAPAADDLFTLLYTSGTTGVPKGCMLTHRNITCIVLRHAAIMRLGPGSRSTAYASFGFDASVMELFPVIGTGATLYIVPQKIRLDLPALARFFADNGVTHAFMTTQVATQFAINHPRCGSLEVLYTGGEKMPSFPPPSYRLFNCYGPTESIAYVICKEVRIQEENIPIGKPIPGIKAYVVSKSGARLPVGAAGELVEAGEQVGDGYLRRPEKTAEVFLDNPYDDDPAYRKAYRTGDVVRFRPDGDIEFIGRKDSQVKIRGFRVELSEIENVIREHPDIKDVTVQAFEDKAGGKFIAAYIVSPVTIDPSELQDFIAGRKPPYMVPPVVMQIDAIPLNVNQKVDRKALPEPRSQAHAKPAEEAAPLNVLEEEIKGIIEKTAGIEGFGLTDPLFNYGMTSLSALRLATELYKRYGIDSDMASFAKTATLQSIENTVLGALMSGAAKAGAGDSADEELGPQEMTFQQTGLYLDCMKAPSATIYNLPFAWTFPEGTDPEDVRRAALAVLSAHPSILTKFVQKDGKVFLTPTGQPPVVDLYEGDYDSVKEHFVRPFSLHEGPLYRIEIVVSGGRVHMFSDFHHIVFDGLSYDLFMRELLAAMGGKEPGKESYTYLHYARDQKAAQDGAQFREAAEFFAKVMEGFESADSILPDLVRPEGALGHEARIRRKLGHGIPERCHQLGISHASYFIGVTAVALGAFSRSGKVFFCTISNGRGADLRCTDVLGMFVNTLPLAADVETGSTDAFLKEMARRFAATLPYENYPFAKISSDYGFQPNVMMAYEVGVLDEYKTSLGALAGEDLEIGVPKFPVCIFVEGTEGDEQINLAYDDSLYSREIMSSFLDCLAIVADGLLVDRPMTEVPFVDGQRLLELDSFNNVPEPAPECTTETIVSLFRRQAAACPGAPAVYYEGRTITYRELDGITDRIASRIASLGLGREDVVSILIGRSENMVVASLGALKAGCAYQPLDPSYPKERLGFMVADAGASLLISDDSLVGLVEGYTGPVLSAGALEDLPEGPVPEGPVPGGLFILLYTSGSTGTPKGCMLDHGNLVNFCSWYRRYYGIGPGDKAAAYASYGFDACMMDIYPALTSGACVCIIPEETRHDMVQLDRYFTENGITHVFMTTQMGVLYARNYPGNKSLRHLSVGGEKLVSIDPPSYSFHNGYGPTECTIFSTIFPVLRKEPNIPIGRPLDGVSLYVVDRHMRRVPQGAAGELLITGGGVGRGYLRRPELTAKSFPEDPFRPGSRAYRSGDTVRYRPNGDIEYIGRGDSQVKVRGFRIELKEVEGVIRDIPGVRDVTVQAFDKPSGGKFLAAYVVAEGVFDPKAAGEFIRERKPPYMVPESFTQLEKIPLNVNQKVDRKALPAPAPATSGEYAAPQTPTEAALCEVFAQVLETERVGATDNFFDIGGTSLVVTNVLVSAQKKGLVFAYADVFSHPTARTLAAYLDGTDSTPPEDGGVRDYDYGAIDKLLAGNTLDALRTGRMQPLGRNILLTGVTGYLGIHLLRELLRRTPDDTVVWCLIRTRSTGSTTGWLKEMLVYYFAEDYIPLVGKRIRIVEGDITQKEVFDSLVMSGIPMDMVVNSAANVKHFSKGTDIEDVNYGGAKNVVAYCERVQARLVHISTESVGGSVPGVQPMVFNERQLYFRQVTDNQYVHSKFMAERYILEHMAAGTLNAKIMRAGNLSPRASDGEFQMNFNTNAAMSRMRADKLLGAAPYEILTTRMEFTPVDEAATAICLLATTPRENCVFHVSNNHLIPMEDIMERLSLVEGKPIRYKESAEFNAILDAGLSDPGLAPRLSALIAYSKAPDKEPEVENWASTQFTVQVLLRLGFAWNTTSSEYLDKLFNILSLMQFFS